MKSLIDNYKKIESRLHQEAEIATTPKEIIQIIQNEIEGIAHHDSEYILGLTDSQRTLAWEQLTALSDSFNLLNAIEISQLYKEQSSPTYQQKGYDKDNRNQDMNNIVLGAASGFVAGTFTGVPIVGTAVGTVVGTGVGLVSNFISKNQDTQKIDSNANQENRILSLQINPEPLLSHLYRGFENIDKMVIRCLEERRKQPDKPDLDKLTDVLGLLQDLMGEELDEQNQIPTLVGKQLKRIPAVLRHYGIETRVYEAKGELSDRDWARFEFEPSLEPDSQEYVTMKPAFIKGDEVILQGQVIEPATSQK